MTWTNFTRPSSFLSGGYFLLKGAGDLFKTQPFTDGPITAVIILNQKNMIPSLYVKFLVNGDAED